MKKIKVIEPVRNDVLKEFRSKKRVCAYCRVSTDSNKQHSSYLAQIEYYKNYIEQNEQWEFVGIYADESSGTKLKNRNEFLKMINDCENGKIDMIITKSVTRFARNSEDSIETIRKLKSLNIAIYFENQGINTMTENNEIMLTILSSIAQDEAQNISKNTKWGIQKRFNDGTYILSCVAFGYTKDQNGELIVQPEESKIVRKIYESYLDGKGAYSIAKELNISKVKPIRSAEKWRENTVTKILKNPVYKGELLMQKTYTTQSLPFKKKSNNGVLPMFSICDNHEPIVSEAEFNAVQEIFADRRLSKTTSFQKYTFSGKIVCKHCGSKFRRQKLYIGKPYETVQWCCKTHITDIETCPVKAVKEQTIQQAFMKMWNDLVEKQDKLIFPILENSKHKNELKKLDLELNKITDKHKVLTRILNKGYMDSAVYIAEQNILNIKIEEIKKQKSYLQNDEILAKTMELARLINKYGIIEKYNDELFKQAVVQIQINENEIIFKLINELEMR